MDERDPGATVEDPLGTGLSLAEAIILSNNTPGVQIITVEPGTTVVLDRYLPYVTDATVIDGNELAAGNTNIEERITDIGPPQ